MIFHQSTLERMPSILAWLSNWNFTSFRVTEPKDWFYNSHQRYTLSLPANNETLVWNLRPGSVIDALEDLSQYCSKRHDILVGVVIIPKYLRPEWFHCLVNIVDLYFFISVSDL